MNKKAIVYAVDSSVECLLQLVTSIKSVRRLSPEPIDIYICTDSPRKWMEGIYGAKILDVGDLAREYGLYGTNLVWRKNDVPPMLLFRLLIPLVPELQQYDQVLYLDTDTEVWGPEFFTIFGIDGNCEIIGVKDSLGKAGASHRIRMLRLKGGLDWKDKEGITNRWDEIIERRGKYANSGVLVFNMDKFRDVEKYSERIKYVLDKVVTLKPYYSDQDALNVYFSIYVVDDRRFNGWSRKVTEAFLRHYVGTERKKSGQYPLDTQFRPAAKLDSVEKNDSLGAFSGVVDNVYVLANSTDKGYEEIMSAWLSDVGVSKYIKIDTTPSGEYTGLLNMVPHDDVKSEHLDNWIGHYKAVVDAIDKGYDKIAVFEDTFRPEGLEDQLASLPADFDIAICSQGKGAFVKNNNFSADSSKGYLLSRKCMVDLRRLFESLWDESVPGRRLRYVHKWLNRKILVKERGFTRI